MFSDVKDKFNDPRYRKTFQGINFQDLLYADDTLIVAKFRKSANDNLHLIEEESEYLHLKLNHTKGCYIVTVEVQCGSRTASKRSAQKELPT